jgi:3D (Asp-Asp-Asp) domain-containing protein
MLLSRSLRRKLLATVLSAAALVLVYEATVIDSRTVPVQAAAGLPLVAGAKAEFVATAYCKGTTTRSGVNVRAGILAADPKVLPEGSVVQLEGVPEAYEGIYAVMDTGPKVKGRHVDMYIWSCYEALDFGRRPVTLTVLRLGWSPKSSTGGLN